MKHVFIIGSKGIPAQYGGFETFVDQLVSRKVSEDIQYHVACAAKDGGDSESEYNGAHCFNIAWRTKGPSKAVFFDIDALRWTVRYINDNAIESPVVYVLACRVGPFIGKYAKAIRDAGGTLLVNPDGHEWKRSKWNALVRRYWRLSERGMVGNADVVVCDSRSIEDYILAEYGRPGLKTTYIAYGADVRRSDLADNDEGFAAWLGGNGLSEFGYYLVVGRSVPENNYETMIREFIASGTQRSLALVTEANPSFVEDLQRRTGFRDDPRVKFVGTVYDKQLLKKIRENAFAYLHGHEVGGTNPSLLEALASTRLNLLLDVCFNREVAEESALYWDKQPDSLASLIDAVEGLDEDAIGAFDTLSTDVIRHRFSWEQIVGSYEELFLGAAGSDRGAA